MAGELVRGELRTRDVRYVVVDTFYVAAWQADHCLFEHMAHVVQYTVLSSCQLSYHVVCCQARFKGGRRLDRFVGCHPLLFTDDSSPQIK